MPFHYNLYASETNNYPQGRIVADQHLYENKKAQAALVQYTQERQEAYLREVVETGISRSFEGELTKVEELSPKSKAAKFVDPRYWLRPASAASKGLSFAASHATLPLRDRTAGVLSAHYPTQAPVSRPGWQPPNAQLGLLIANRPPPTRAQLANPAVAIPPQMRPQSAPPAVMLRGPRAPVAANVEPRTLRLLHTLHATALRDLPLPALPIRPHAKRQPSASRGLSLPALKAVRSFYKAAGALATPLAAVCDGMGAGSLCALTRGSGLSLAETLHEACEAATSSLHPVIRVGGSCLQPSGAGVAIAKIASATRGSAGILGPATTLVQCPVTDPTEGGAPLLLGQLLDCIISTCAAQDAIADASDDQVPHTRYFWIEAFSTSQNLAAGHFGPHLCEPGTAARAARSEDVPGATQSAMASVREVFVAHGAEGTCAIEPKKAW